jgi:hypothetical protein
MYPFPRVSPQDCIEGRSVQSPTSFLPRDAGEEGGGLNDLNDLNGLNEFM